MQTIVVHAPKEIFNIKEFQKGLLDALADTAEEASTLFKSSFKYWEHQPQVHSKITKGADYNEARVWIDDEQYARVSNGTKQHLVGTSRQLMRFAGYNPKTNKTARRGLGANKHIYKPKTSPDRIDSKPGFPAVGTQMIVRRGPWPVSGIEPRKFDVQIANAVKSKFIADTRKVVAKAAKGVK